MKKYILPVIVALLLFSHVKLAESNHQNSTIFQYSGTAVSSFVSNRQHIIFETCVNDHNTETFDPYRDFLKKQIYCVSKSDGVTVWVKEYSEKQRIRDMQCDEEYLCVQVDIYDVVGHYDTVVETTIFCYRISDGEEVWRKVFISKSDKDTGYYLRLPSRLLIHERKIYYSYWEIYALDITNGSELSKIDVDYVRAKPACAVGNKIFFYAPASIICIEGNKLAWQTDSKVLVVSPFCEVDGDSCIEIKKYSKSFDTDKLFLFSGEVVVVGNKNDSLYYAIINKDNGSFERITRLSESNFAEVIMYNKDFIIIRDLLSDIECYNTQGTLLWKTGYSLRKFFEPIDTYNNYVVIAEGKPIQIKGLNISDGKVAWEYKPDVKVIDNVVIDGDSLYIFGDNKCQKFNLDELISLNLIRAGTGEEPIVINKLEYQVSSKTMKVNGQAKEIDAPPVIKNSVTYISAKYLIEPLGGIITWEASTKKITSKLADKTIEMQINNPTATVNGKSVQIDSKNPKITPIIINGRTMVPLRFLAESLGCKVEWKSDTKEIIVTYQP